MKIELKPGDDLDVTLAHSDGGFTVEYGETTVRVMANLPDDQEREGVIYEHVFIEDDENPSDEVERLREENKELKAALASVPVEFEPEYDKDGEPLPG